MYKNDILMLGAVAYDPKVVAIWDGFSRYFANHGLAFDYALYSNYEKQVEAHFSGHIHIAWNSPLAWLQSERIGKALGRKVESICMRDTDRDLTSLILVRSESDIRDLSSLKNKRVAIGAQDSPQSTLIPLNYIAVAGLNPNKDFQVVAFDMMVGKHGDHIGGERDAVRALVRGEVDAACIIDSNHLVFIQENTLPSSAIRILARTPNYDHCNFTTLDNTPIELIGRFRELLIGMSYSDAEVRPLLDLEGLKQWQPGRINGYAALSEAVDRFGTIDAFVARVVDQCK